MPPKRRIGTVGRSADMKATMIHNRTRDPRRHVADACACRPRKAERATLKRPVRSGGRRA